MAKEINIEIGIDIGSKEIYTLSSTKEQLFLLDLMALRHQVSRSVMVARLISLHSDVDIFITEIAERIVGEYCEKNIDFEQYLKSAAIWLESKKISAYYRERIIEEVRRNYAS